MIVQRLAAFSRAIVPQLLILLTACSSIAPAAAVPPSPSPTVAAATATPAATATAVVQPTAAAREARIGGGSAVLAGTEPQATAAPTAILTPTPRPYGTPARIGIQIGHLDSDQLPDELARLRTSTGAFYNGIDEYESNQAIAAAMKVLLEEAGVIVDLIPATVPPAYRADAFIAIHADGAAGNKRGWKIATPWRTSRASQELLDAVSATYGVISGIPEDVGGVSVNMRGYYAFSYRRYLHAIHPTTPAIIVETGFLTSAADRAIIVNRPEVAARAIVEGVLDYLRLRDPRDGAGLIPPQFPSMRALEGAVIRRAPSDQASIVIEVPAGARVVVFREQDGWYEMFARIDEATWIGWIRTDEVEVTNEPWMVPTPENANP